MERKMSRKWRDFARFSLLICSIIFLADCSVLAPTVGHTSGYRRGCTMAKIWQSCPMVNATGLPGTMNPDVAPFHSVHIAGPYNVSLRPDRGSRNVVIHGDASVIGRTHVYVKDGVLKIKAADNFSYGNHNLANVDIRMGGVSKIIF